MHIEYYLVQLFGQYIFLEERIVESDIRLQDEQPPLLATYYKWITLIYNMS